MIYKVKLGDFHKGKLTTCAEATRDDDGSSRELCIKILIVSFELILAAWGNMATISLNKNGYISTWNMSTKWPGTFDNVTFWQVANNFHRTSQTKQFGTEQHGTMNSTTIQQQNEICHYQHMVCRYIYHQEVHCFHKQCGGLFDAKPSSEPVMVFHRLDNNPYDI